MGTSIGLTSIIISILILILFIGGLRTSAIHSFKAGIYFFLILIIREIYLLVSPYFIQNHIEKLISENKELMIGMTIGEFTAFLSLIPKALLFVAFLILVLGLRNLFRLRSGSPQQS